MGSVHSMTSSDAVAIVVVNYGSHELLEANLLKVARGTPEAYVVVVDNFSSQQEREAVLKQAEQFGWETVLPSSNLGFGAGMNLGVEKAQALGATSFLLLNPDASLDADSFNALRKQVSAQPRNLVSPTVIRPDGSVWFAGVDLDLDSGTMRSWRKRNPADGRRTEPWLSGACLMVGLELWQELGGFTPDYFLYWEDVDLSHRTRLAGGDVVVLAGATAVHDEGGTHEVQTRSKAGHGKSYTYYYYNLRNRLLFAAQHLDEKDVRRWMRTSAAAARGVLLQGGRRQFLRPVQPLLAAIRGTRDGLRIARVELKRRSSPEATSVPPESRAERL